MSFKPSFIVFLIFMRCLFIQKPHRLSYPVCLYIAIYFLYLFFHNVTLFTRTENLPPATFHARFGIIQKAARYNFCPPFYYLNNLYNHLINNTIYAAKHNVTIYVSRSNRCVNVRITPIPSIGVPAYTSASPLSVPGV